MNIQLKQNNGKLLRKLKRQQKCEWFYDLKFCIKLKYIMLINKYK
ncbi:hypothetical protein [Tenacibaculum phage JQ]|nr:hypothetical protein [Tenacibaculum phage JQ]